MDFAKYSYQVEKDKKIARTEGYYKLHSYKFCDKLWLRKKLVTDA